MTTLVSPTKETLGNIVRHGLPKADVFYRDSDHSYWSGCKENPKAAGGFSGTGRLTGVSTLCKPFDWNPDNLMRWVERLTLEGVSRGFTDQKVPGDPFALRTILEQKNLRWEQIRDEAGYRGTKVHDIILNALATAEDVPDLSALPEALRGYGQAVMKWWHFRDPEVLYAEQVVCSPEHGFAGRVDLVCKIKDPLRPGPVVVDLKTGSFISNGDMVQPLGYDLGLVHSGLLDESADGHLIVQVDDKGSFREIWTPAGHDEFLAALTIYRMAPALGKAARA